LSGTAPESRPRIQGLSDLIFGLALSIGAIQLTLGGVPQNNSQIIEPVTAFGFSFLVLINVWNRYTSIATPVPVESGAMVRLNIMLLFLVAIEPYLFNLLLSPSLGPGLNQYVSIYYAFDLAAMNGVLAYFAHLLTDEKKKLVPMESVPSFRLMRDRLLIATILFGASTVPVFWTIFIFGIPMRFVLWGLTIPVGWARRVYGKRKLMATSGAR
jgi:uncharacterized membrane protein